MAAQSNALMPLSKAREWLAKADDVLDVIDLRDKAAALEYYRRASKESLESQNEAAEIKVRAERRAGEILAGMEKAKGSAGAGRPRKGGNTVLPPKDVPTLSDVGVSKIESSRLQAVAAVPEKDFERYVQQQKQSGREITTTDLRRMGQRQKRVQQKRSKLAAAPAASSFASASDAPQTWKIVHGDCVQCLSNLIPGSVQLVFADPPYNIGVDYGGGSKADQLSEQQFVDWAASWIEPAIAALADDGSIWVMINDEYAAEFCLILKRCGLHMRNWIKWYETFGVNCASKFNRCSRHILYFTKSAKKFVFNTDAVSRPSDRQVIYKDRRADHHGKLWDDVWWIPRLTGTSAERLPDFPTQLPLELVRAIVQCASDPGDLVVDPFCGSGTTGVACIESGRQFVGIEREVKWYEMATRRLASTTHARAAR